MELVGSTNVQAATSPSSSYIQLSSDKSNLKAGDTATFKLKSTESLQSVTMQVLTRGYVIVTQQIAMNGTDGTISFPTTAEMAPKSQIIVYAIQDANKVHININVAGCPIGYLILATIGWGISHLENFLNWTLCPQG